MTRGWVIIVFPTNQNFKRLKPIYVTSEKKAPLFRHHHLLPLNLKCEFRNTKETHRLWHVVNLESMAFQNHIHTIRFRHKVTVTDCKQNRRQHHSCCEFCSKHLQFPIVCAVLFRRHVVCFVLCFEIAKQVEFFFCCNLFAAV